MTKYLNLNAKLGAKDAIKTGRQIICEQQARIAELKSDIAQLQDDLVLSDLASKCLKAENAKLREALKPFANYACDPPCGCHNCIARQALKEVPNA